MQPDTAAPATPPILGMGHFIAQTDAVGQTLLGVLLLMSLISWTIIGLKGVNLIAQRRRSAAFLRFFWNASSLDAVAAEIGRDGVKEPYAHLAAQALQAQAHHARHAPARLEEAGSVGDFVTRTIKKVLDEETTRLENGLTVLATVGATAPFVGLFGTVWGVYGALVAIGANGAGTLDRIAGPVGEALIMTGLGLAVAIPAVMGYNWLVRANRVLAGQLDAYAYELHTFAAMGSPLRLRTTAATAPAPAGARAGSLAAAASPVRAAVTT